MAGAPGQKIFSKKMKATDVAHRLHWPAEFLEELPSFNGGHQVDFTAKDSDGTIWSFTCSKRITGRYGKPVVSRGWIPFLKSKGGFDVGDEVIFYRNDDDPDAHFAIRLKRNVMLFGTNINDKEI